MIAYRVFRPTSPSCLEPAFPTQTTLQRSGLGHLFVEDKFDHLAAPKVETSAQPEAFFRGIEDEARGPLWLTVQIDDQAGAPLQHQTLRAAGFGDLKAGHSFNHWSTGSDATPGLVSFEMRNDETLASCGVPQASNS